MPTIIGGLLKRGLEIIKQHSKIIKKYKINAAFKLQIRDVDNFVHSEFKGNKSIRYINKTENTKLSLDEFKILINQIKKISTLLVRSPLTSHLLKFVKY